MTKEVENTELIKAIGALSSEIRRLNANMLDMQAKLDEATDRLERALKRIEQEI